MVERAVLQHQNDEVIKCLSGHGRIRFGLFASLSVRVSAARLVETNAETKVRHAEGQRGW